MKKYKLIIIDDDISLLEELEDFLSSQNFKVWILSDSSKALNVIEQVKPDLILLDIRMDKLSGFQIADRIKRNIDDSIPVIAMTGVFTREGDSKLMNICGIDECIHKPFNPDEMLSAIEKALDKFSVCR